MIKLPSIKWKKCVAGLLAAVQFLSAGDWAAAFEYYIPKEYSEDRERSGYFSPEKVLQRMQRQNAAVQQKNNILRMADSYALALAVTQKVDEQNRKNIADLQRTAQMIQRNLARIRSKRYQIAGQKEGFSYIAYDDGKKVWLKDGLACQVDNEKIIDAMGNVSMRNMYDIQYNEKRLMTSYTAETTDAAGLTTTVIWADAVYSDDSVFYADDETRAKKELISFKEIVIDPQGNTTSLFRDNAEFNNEGLVESYTEVSLDSFGNAQTKIWSGAQYDGNKNITGFQETVVDSFGNKSTRTWYGGQYEKNAYYDEQDPYQRQAEYLLTGYHEDVVDSHGNITSKDWFGAEYNQYGLLKEYQENVIDELGLYSGIHWQDGVYDASGRVASYYETRYDTFGNVSTCEWRNARYDVFGNLLSFEEKIIDSYGNVEEHERAGCVYNTQRQLLEYTDISRDIFGNTRSYFWQAKEYDSHNRVTAYYKEEHDVLGNKQVINWTGGIYDDENRILSYTETITDSFGNTTAIERYNTRYNTKDQAIYYQEKQRDRYGSISRETFKDAAYDEYGRLFSYKKEMIDAYSKRAEVERAETYYDEFNRLSAYKEDRIDYDRLRSKIYWFNAVYNHTHQLTAYQVDYTKMGSTVSEAWSDIRYDAYGRTSDYRLVRDTVSLGLQRDFILPDWNIWNGYSETDQRLLLAGETLIKDGKEVFLLYEENETTNSEHAEISRLKTVYDNHGRVVSFEEKEVIYSNNEKDTGRTIVRSQSDVYAPDNELQTSVLSERTWYQDGSVKKTVQVRTVESRDSRGRECAYQETDTTTMTDVLGGVVYQKELHTKRQDIRYNISGLVERYTDVSVDSVSSVEKTTTVDAIVYNADFQRLSYRMNSVEITDGYTQESTTVRSDIAYNAYGQMVSYKDAVTDPNTNVTQNMYSFGILYNAAGTEVLNQYQLSISQGRAKDGSYLYETDLKKMYEMEYNQFGALCAWKQDVMSNKKPNLVNEAKIDVTFDVSGRQRSYCEEGVTRALGAGDFYETYSFEKKDIVYNRQNLASAWTQVQTSSSKPSLVNEASVMIVYGKDGRALHYRERGSHYDTAKQMIEETYLLEKTDITYNELNQSSAWNQRDWSSSSESLEEISSVSVQYNQNGSESYFSQKGVKESRYGTGYRETFSVERNDMQYNSFGQAVSWRQTTGSSQSPDVKTVSIIEAAYDNRGLQILYKEDGVRSSTGAGAAAERYTFIKKGITYNDIGQAISWQQTQSSNAHENLLSASEITAEYDAQGRLFNIYENSIQRSIADGAVSLNIASYLYKTDITYNAYGLIEGFNKKEWHSSADTVMSDTAVRIEYNGNGMTAFYREEGKKRGVNGSSFEEDIRIIKSGFEYDNLGMLSAWHEDTWSSANPMLHILTESRAYYDAFFRQSAVEETVRKYGKDGDSAIDTTTHIVKQGIEYNALGQMIHWGQTLRESSAPDIRTESVIDCAYDILGRQSAYHEKGASITNSGSLNTYTTDKNNFIYTGTGSAASWHEETWQSSTPDIAVYVDTRCDYDQEGRVSSLHNNIKKMQKSDGTILEETVLDKNDFTYNSFGLAVSWLQYADSLKGIGADASRTSATEYQYASLYDKNGSITGFTSISFIGTELTVNGTEVHISSLRNDERINMVQDLIDKTVDVEELVSITVQKSALYNNCGQIMETDAMSYVRGYSMTGFDEYSGLLGQIDDVQTSINVLSGVIEGLQYDASSGDLEELLTKIKNMLNIPVNTDVKEYITVHLQELYDNSVALSGELSGLMNDQYAADLERNTILNNLAAAREFIALMQKELTTMDEKGFEFYVLAGDSSLKSMLDGYYAALEAARADMIAARDAYALSESEAAARLNDRSVALTQINGVELSLGTDEFVSISPFLYNGNIDNIVKGYQKYVYFDSQEQLHCKRVYQRKG